MMWRSIKKRDRPQGYPFWFLNFQHDVEMSLVRTRFSRHSKKERNDYGVKISKKSKELALLLKGSGFDDCIYQTMNIDTQTRLSSELTKEGFSQHFSPAQLLEFETGFLWVSDFLMQLAESSEKKGNTTNVIQTSNTSNADQVYYMRHLTKCMRYRFDTPMRNVVAVSASIIFDNPLIDPAYVAKFAP